MTSTPTAVRLSTGRVVNVAPRPMGRYRRSQAPAPSGCIEWTACLDRDGYGVFQVKDRGRVTLLAAHRVAFVLEHGQVPEGMTIDHKCENRKCVNGKHLQALTRTDNTRKSSKNPAVLNSRKTHCLAGHEFDWSNTYIDPAGGRQCRKCRVRRSAKYRGKSQSQQPA